MWDDNSIERDKITLGRVEICNAIKSIFSKRKNNIFCITIMLGMITAWKEIRQD